MLIKGTEEMLYKETEKSGSLLLKKEKSDRGYDQGLQNYECSGNGTHRTAFRCI